MTHIENIPHVFQYGITHSSSPNANTAFVPIGDSSLIASRSQFELNNGRLLGEYIPLLGYLVYNETAKQKLLNFGIKEAMVHIRSQDYF